MKKIFAFEELITGKLIRVFWGIYAVLLILTIPVTGVAMFFSAGGCGELGHEPGVHACYPPFTEWFAVMLATILSAVVLILVSRIAAEFVIVIFRIYDELRAANA